MGKSLYFRKTFFCGDYDIDRHLSNIIKFVRTPPPPFFTYREVDQFEFLTFMLASMQKVEPEMMMDLKDLFERLDVNGSGTVQKEDLVLAAKKRRDPWNLRNAKK